MAGPGRRTAARGPAGGGRGRRSAPGAWARGRPWISSRSACRSSSIRRAMRSSKVVRASPSGARRTSGASSRTAASLASTGASDAPPWQWRSTARAMRKSVSGMAAAIRASTPALPWARAKSSGSTFPASDGSTATLPETLGGEQHLRGLGGRGEASLVPVEEDHHLAAVAALEQLEVLRGERGAADRHRVPDPGLVQADDVEVPLDQHRRAGLADGLAGEVEAVEHAALLVEHRLRGVDVLRALLVPHGAGAEADDRPVEGDDGEHEPAAEPVVPAAVAGDAQAGAVDGGQRDLLRRQPAAEGRSTPARRCPGGSGATPPRRCRATRGRSAPTRRAGSRGGPASSGRPRRTRRGPRRAPCASGGPRRCPRRTPPESRRRPRRPRTSPPPGTPFPRASAGT